MWTNPAMDWIDLRSDTVTHPTPEMRRAMAEASVGDDVFGDDPTVQELEDRAAELIGKEAAVFVPSGTMGNLTAILAHCQRGDEAILGDQSHTFISEAGGIAALGGIHPHPLPNRSDGSIELDRIEAAIRPDDPHEPISRLLCLENTHNLCGGEVLSLEYHRQAAQLARSHGLSLHIDGARIFNAAAALEVPARDLAREADSVTFCLSKGLCAPVGSLVCGEAGFIGRARRMRKQLGGGMRQVGVLAAAGLVALDTMIERLSEDHVRARRLAQGLAALPALELRTLSPPTNMIYLRLTPEAPLDAVALAARLAERRIRVNPRAGNSMRLVTHYWINDEAVETTIQSFAEVLGG